MPLITKEHSPLCLGEFDVALRYYRGKALIFAALYVGDQNALVLHSPEGEPLCTASVALEHIPQEPNEVFIKNWSENENVYDSLRNLDLIQAMKRTEPCGFVEAYVCDFTPKTIDLIKKVMEGEDNRYNLGVRMNFGEHRPH